VKGEKICNLFAIYFVFAMPQMIGNRKLQASLIFILQNPQNNHIKQLQQK